MRKVSSLTSKDVAVDRLLTETGYANVALVAEYVEPIAQVATIVNQGVDFNTLAEVLTNLDEIDAAKLSELATADLLEITQDLSKGSYLGSRKIDIDLSLQVNADGTATSYQQANIITEDGVNIAIPFYADGTTIISETTSPSIILQKINKGINAYNANEPNEFKHVVNTEYDLMNEVDVTKPTVIRVRDTDGHSSTISRIELIRYPDAAVTSYVWADTTSALEVLANRVQELITIGQSINSIVVLASKIDEMLLLQTGLDQLINNADSLYVNMDKLTSIYTEVSKLVEVYNDISDGGTNYTNTVAIDLQDTDSKIKRLADDMKLASAGMVGTIIDNLPKVTSVYENITNGKLISIFNNIDNGNIAKVVAGIDNGDIDKLVLTIDDLAIDKIVTNIDNNNVNKIVTSINDGSLNTVADNATKLAEIQTNLTQILEARDNADIAAAKAIIATNQANIATEQAESIHTLQADALTLTAGSNASVSYNSSNNKLILGIPEGPKGDRGDAFNVDSTGPLSGRSSYDGQPQGYSFLATDTGELYIKQSDASGDWSPAIPFGKGDKGAPGSGIASISFTGTTDPSGLPGRLNAVDTYTITLDDGTSTTFNVTNGFGKTVVKCVSDYIAKNGDSALCDTTAIQQIDNINSIVVENGTEYSLQINNSTVSYTSDTYVNQTDTVDSITVEDETTYGLSIDIDGTAYTPSYTSDAAVAQIDVIDDIIVTDDTDYTIQINNTVLTYHSDAAVAQVNTITNIVVDSNTSYTVTVDGTDITYTSDAAVAQQDDITNITVADDTTYAITVDGTEVSFTTGTDAVLQDVIDGLVDAVTNNTTVSDIVTASSLTEGFKLTANTAGTPFTTSVTSGSMDLTTVVANDNATESEILNGIRNAINNSGLNISATSITNGVSVTADVAGTGFTMSTPTANMTITLVIDNNNATLDEILAGLQVEVANSPEPIDTSISNNTLRLIAHVPGVAFTSSVLSSNMTITTEVVNDNATIEEVVTGLVDAVNTDVTGVTAVGKGTYLTISANTHTTTFTTTVTDGSMTVSTLSADDATLNEIINGLYDAIAASVEPIIATIETDNSITIKANVVGQGYTIAVVTGGMTVSSVVPNQEGITTLTLPANPNFGDTITVVDVANSFATKPLVVARNGNLINGLDEDLEVDVNNANVDMIFVDNDWRFE